MTNAEFVELWKALTGQTTELADAYFHLADITDDKVINQADYGLLYHVFDLNSKNLLSLYSSKLVSGARRKCLF